MTRQREVINDTSPTDRGRLFLSADGRSVEGRRWSDIYQALLADYGGVGKVSDTTRLLLRGITTMMLNSEKMEDLLISGDDSHDPEKHSRLIGQITRSLEGIKPGSGKGRKGKEKEYDSLEEYIGSDGVQERLRRKHANHECRSGCFKNEEDWIAYQRNNRSKSQ